jgi:hypothetical protein
MTVKTDIFILVPGAYDNGLPGECCSSVELAARHNKDQDVCLVASDNHDATWYSDFIARLEECDIRNVRVISAAEMFDILQVLAVENGDVLAMKYLPELRNEYKKCAAAAYGGTLHDPFCDWGKYITILRTVLCAYYKCPSNDGVTRQMAVLNVFDAEQTVAPWGDCEVDRVYGVARRSCEGVIMIRLNSPYQEDLREAMHDYSRGRPLSHRVSNPCTLMIDSRIRFGEEGTAKGMLRAAKIALEEWRAVLEECTDKGGLGRIDAAERVFQERREEYEILREAIEGGGLVAMGSDLIIKGPSPMLTQAAASAAAAVANCPR